METCPSILSTPLPPFLSHPHFPSIRVILALPAPQEGLVTQADEVQLEPRSEYCKYIDHTSAFFTPYVLPSPHLLNPHLPCPTFPIFSASISLFVLPSFSLPPQGEKGRQGDRGMKGEIGLPGFRGLPGMRVTITSSLLHSSSFLLLFFSSPPSLSSLSPLHEPPCLSAGHRWDEWYRWCRWFRWDQWNPGRQGREGMCAWVRACVRACVWSCSSPWAVHSFLSLTESSLA